jgi:hypothetical protein
MKTVSNVRGIVLNYATALLPNFLCSMRDTMLDIAPEEDGRQDKKV